MATCEVRIQYNIPRNSANIRKNTQMLLVGTVKEGERFISNDCVYTIHSVTYNESAVTNPDVSLSAMGVISVGDVTAGTVIVVRVTCAYNVSVYKDLTLVVTD